MSKRSQSLSLVLMGTLTVGLAGCSEEPAESFRAYTSVDECVKEQIYSSQECRDMAVAAVRETPSFTNKAECEKEFGEGNCNNTPEKAAAGNETVRNGGGSSWMPLIAGYMVGRYLGGGGGFMQGAQPLFRQPDMQPQGQSAGQAPAQAAGQAGSRASGGFARSFRTLGGGSVQTDAAGKIASVPQGVRQGFTRTAKPYAGRSGLGTSGGFAGGRSAT